MSEGTRSRRGRLAGAGACLALVAALWVGVGSVPASHEGPVSPDGFWDGGFGPDNEHEIEVRANGDGTWTGTVSDAAASGCTSFPLEGSAFSHAVAAGPNGAVAWKLMRRVDSDSFAGEVLVDPRCTNGATARGYWPATFEIDEAHQTMQVRTTNPAGGPDGSPDEVAETYSNPNLGDAGVSEGTKGSVKPTKRKIRKKDNLAIKVKAKQPTAFGSYSYRMYAVVKQKKKCNSRFVSGLFAAGKGATKKMKVKVKQGRELKKSASGNEKGLKKPPDIGLDQSAFGKKRKKWCKGQMHISVREFFTPAGETDHTQITVLGRAKVKVK